MNFVSAALVVKFGQYGGKQRIRGKRRMYTGADALPKKFAFKHLEPELQWLRFLRALFSGQML